MSLHYSVIISETIIFKINKQTEEVSQVSKAIHNKRNTHLFSFSLRADLACSFSPVRSCLTLLKNCEHSSSPAQNHPRPHLHSTENTYTNKVSLWRTAYPSHKLEFFFCFQSLSWFLICYTVNVNFICKDDNSDLHPLLHTGNFKLFIFLIYS